MSIRNYTKSEVLLLDHSKMTPPGVGGGEYQNNDKGGRSSLSIETSPIPFFQ